MTTLADTYLAKLGISNMKTYPRVPLTIFMSKEQLDIWTQLNKLDKDIQASTELMTGLGGVSVSGSAASVITPSNIFINPAQSLGQFNVSIPGISGVSGIQNVNVNGISFPSPTFTTISKSVNKRFKAKKPKHTHAIPQPMVRRTYKSRKIMPMEMRIKV